MDLFAAGMAETPVSDGQLGPTFTCLLGLQFKEIKLGDRFYYQFEDAGFSAGAQRRQCDASAPAV